MKNSNKNIRKTDRVKVDGVTRAVIREKVMSLVFGNWELLDGFFEQCSPDERKTFLQVCSEAVRAGGHVMVAVGGYLLRPVECRQPLDMSPLDECVDRLRHSVYNLAAVLAWPNPDWKLMTGNFTPPTGVVAGIRMPWAWLENNAGYPKSDTVYDVQLDRYMEKERFYAATGVSDIAPYYNWQLGVRRNLGVVRRHSGVVVRDRRMWWPDPTDDPRHLKCYEAMWKEMGRRGLRDCA